MLTRYAKYNKIEIEVVEPDTEYEFIDEDFTHY